MPFSPSPTNLQPLLQQVANLAKQAGEHIMAIYQTPFEETIEKKQDNSPLTRADIASHQTIVAGLQQLTPDWAILSEESAEIPFTERATWQRYWLVDPLDGTKEFVKRNGEFTVNIALIEQNIPILGVVYVPVTQTLYTAALHCGSYVETPTIPQTRIHARRHSQEMLTVAGSRSHADARLPLFLENLQMPIELLNVGSSLKMCLIAQGKVDIYPRIGLTSEWDTAAAQCVVEQAGGCLLNIYDFKSLRYNTQDSILNPYFIAIGDTDAAWLARLQTVAKNVLTT